MTMDGGQENDADGDRIMESIGEHAVDLLPSRVRFDLFGATITVIMATKATINASQ